MWKDAIVHEIAQPGRRHLMCRTLCSAEEQALFKSRAIMAFIRGGQSTKRRDLTGVIWSPSMSPSDAS